MKQWYVKIHEIICKLRFQGYGLFEYMYRDSFSFFSFVHCCQGNRRRIMLTVNVNVNDPHLRGFTFAFCSVFIVLLIENVTDY